MYTSSDHLKKRYRKIGVLFLVFIMIAAGAFVALTSNNRSGADRTESLCLTPADYKDLTGTDSPDSLTPKINFYTASVDFVGKDSYKDTSGTAKLIDTIARFYKTHPDTAIYLRILSYYSSGGEYDTALTRLETLTKDLVAAGVDQDIIHAQPNEVEEDNEEVANDFATITMTSPDGCKEGA